MKKKKTVKQVQALAKRLKIESDDLEAEVLDLKTMEAHQINRLGVDEQVRYLCEELGEEAAWNKIEFAKEIKDAEK